MAEMLSVGLNVCSSCKLYVSLSFDDDDDNDDDDNDDDDDDDGDYDELFYGMVDRRKKFSFISSRNNCNIFSQSPISDTPRARFEPA